MLFAVAAFAMIGMVSFQSSYYINREVDSAHRATVLSFRGLALNLGLGTASLLYTVLIAVLRDQADGSVTDEGLQTLVFVQSLKAFPLYFLLLVGCLALLARLLVKDRKVFVRRPGQPPASDDHWAR